MVNMHVMIFKLMRVRNKLQIYKKYLVSFHNELDTFWSFSTFLLIQ